ncbi:unnamed protein product, partial [Heterotrigona itama]
INRSPHTSNICCESRRRDSTPHKRSRVVTCRNIKEFSRSDLARSVPDRVSTAIQLAKQS